MLNYDSLLGVEFVLWSLFGIFVVLMMALDLGVINRRSHALSLKEASLWSVVWILSALAFNYAIHETLGPVKAMEFLAGYLIEKSLSVDNIFVFIIIFGYFGVSPKQQPRVLKWGIVGALLMRAVLIGAGVVLVESFHWMTYVFGALLLYTVIKMVLLEGESFDPGANVLARGLRRFMPVSAGYQDEHFLIRQDQRWTATPLLLVLLVVESSDLIFALDSIPAIFGVTHDPFIVYTSNIFAIMGLRALYFVLAGMADSFRYLKPGIILILFFVAAKMLIANLYKIPIAVSLMVVGVILGVSIIASLFIKRAEGVAKSKNTEGASLAAALEPPSPNGAGSRNPQKPQSPALRFKQN